MSYHCRCVFKRTTTRKMRIGSGAIRAAFAAAALAAKKPDEKKFFCPIEVLKPQKEQSDIQLSRKVSLLRHCCLVIGSTTVGLHSFTCDILKWPHSSFLWEFSRLFPVRLELLCFGHPTTSFPFRWNFVWGGYLTFWKLMLYPFRTVMPFLQGYCRLSHRIF